jgi:hypothetical protein
MSETVAPYLSQNVRQNNAPISVVPNILPERHNRKVPFIVRANRLLRTTLIAMCGLAILGYGLDVAASNDVGRLEEQARRLNEQNTELSAQLLRVISFQGIQDSVLGRSGLRVPEQVMIVKEVQPYPLAQFEAGKYHLPLMSGY